MTGSEAEGALPPDELAAELQRFRVSDLLAQTCGVLASLGYGKLSPESRDLEQAQVAIEALKALAPLLPDDGRRDVQQVIANLQLAFAEAATAEPGGASH